MNYYSCLDDDISVHQKMNDYWRFLWCFYNKNCLLMDYFEGLNIGILSTGKQWRPVFTTLTGDFH